MNFLLFSWLYSDCEIVGWGMQEYNNTDSYPDSVRAASIQGKLIIIINEKLSKLIHQLKSAVYFLQRWNFDRNVAKNTAKNKIDKNTPTVCQKHDCTFVSCRNGSTPK